jgi:hypothetical protein
MRMSTRRLLLHVVKRFSPQTYEFHRSMSTACAHPSILLRWKQMWPSTLVEPSAVVWLQKHMIDMELQREELLEKGFWREHLLHECISYLMKQLHRKEPRLVAVVLRYFLEMHATRNIFPPIECFLELCAQMGRRDYNEPLKEGKHICAKEEKIET